MTMVEQTSDQRRRNRLRLLIASTEAEGARLQFWARTGALAAIAVALVIVAEWNKALVYSLSTLSIFFFTGLFSYRLAIAGKRKLPVGLFLGIFDIALLTFLMIAPNPFADFTQPAAMSLREGGFKYLLIIVCLGALSLSVRYAVYLGLAAAISWSLGVLWVALQPNSIVPHSFSEHHSHAEMMSLYLDPNFVNLVEQVMNVTLILVISGIIATVVARGRHLADEYTKAERARYNLARHFSPGVVDVISTVDEPFGPIRRREIAVIFADIIGFTAYTENHPPEQVLQLLREFHRRMEQVVFEHQGVVDNYIGDCVMAIFGVPNESDDDAAHALQTTRAMIATVDEWNRERAATGAEPVDIRVGCQFGPVVMGAIGSERNLSFAAVGDTCNVASRLQNLCRELDADICVGAAVIDAALAAGDQEAAAGFINHGPVAVRGRDALVDVWYLPNPDKKAA